MALRSNRKTTPRPRATKAKGAITASKPATRTASQRCADMEGSLFQLSNLADVLAVIADGQDRTELGGALYGIANALRDRYEEIWKRWERLLGELRAAEKGGAS